ncbi:MAG: two-component regulator propeller domain-containing protein [Bacteroidota bacterium]
MRISILILCSLTAITTSGQMKPLPSAALPGLKVENWQMEQGLPVNSIITIAQTKEGWIFFGTEEGLVRFDGADFHVINKNSVPGLGVNFISSLLGSRDSALWIGTEGDGLFCLRNNTYTKYSTSQGLSDTRVYALCEDPHGGIWIGTSGGGLNFLKDGKMRKYDTASGLSNNYIRAIVVDSKNRVWVGTQRGLSVIDNGVIRRYSTKNGLSDNFIEALALDKNNDLWIGTKSGGLNLLRQGRFSAYNMKDGLSSNSVISLLFDTAGMLWIGTNGGGITRMLNGKFHPFTSKDGLSGDLIVTLFKDIEGNIWAGTSGTGIDCIKRKSIQTLTSKDGLSGDVILPVFEDHAGALWVGVAGKGLDRIENGTITSFTRKDGLPEDLVLSICEDSTNTLWIGTTGGGLLSFKDQKFTNLTMADGLSNNVVTVVYPDRSGTLWIGTTGGGVNSYKDRQFSSYTTRDGLSNDNVTCILKDLKGNVWVGTNGGLNRITNNKVITMNKNTGLAGDFILSLYEDPQGNLWVGTAASGLYLIRDNDIRQFSTRNGLTDELVLKILEDDFGYFWISCNKGIYKIKKQDLLDYAESKIKYLTPVLYGKSDGMESTECNGGVSPAGIKRKDGSFWFPTMKGIAIIDPAMMKTASSDYAPIYIDEMRVDGQPVALSSALILPSGSNRLEFRFAALNYTNPGKLRYRCMLVGFDTSWIDNGSSRSAFYTNIPSGNYIFKVIASNESGQWDEKKYAAVKFSFTPPFYRSLIFYLVVTGFFLLLLFFIGYFLLERFHRKRLKRIVEERTNELQQKILDQEVAKEKLQKVNAELNLAKEQAESGDKLKTAFMNNISHEIRTPLNGILGFSRLLADSNLTSEEREYYFSIVSSGSNRLLRTVTDYMDISLIASGNQKVRKSVLNLPALMNEMYTWFNPSFQAKHLLLNMEMPETTVSLEISSDHEILRKIIYQLLDNAYKFTSNGSVTFGFQIKPGELEFFVKDTGVGIGSEVRSKIFDVFVQENIADTRGHEGSGLGLSIVKGFVTLLGGRVWLNSVKGEGSGFYFTLPLEKAVSKPLLKAELPVVSSTRPLILIADNEMSGSLLLEEILFREGIETTVVPDGKQAVDACLKNSSISLVLMDLKMPVMDGYEATRLIKSFNPELPVIAITAYALSGDENKALKAGCDDYLSKPFDKATLMIKLKKYIQ